MDKSDMTTKRRDVWRWLGLLAVLMLPVVASASEAIYMGFSTGPVTYKGAANDLAGAVAATPAAQQPAQGSVQGDNTMVRFWGGYRINESAGVEIGMNTTGNFSRKVVWNNGTTLSRDLNVVSFIVAGVMYIPVLPEFELFWRWGGAMSQVTAVTNDGGPAVQEGSSSASATYGVGASYRYSDHVSFVASFDVLNATLKTATESDRIKLYSTLIGVRLEL